MSSSSRLVRRALRGVSSACLSASLALSGPVFLAGVFSAGALSCGKPPPPTTANVKAGDLPAEGDWSGVFFSPLYGHLHLVKEGGSVSGKWRTQSGDKWGELHGEVTGDLLKFKWVEYKIGMVGPGATTEGRGYFKYIVPPGENVNHEIKGEWGLDKSEVGNPWEAIKQRNMLPNPDSVKPDETEKVNMPDEWDSEGGSKPAGGAPDESTETPPTEDTGDSEEK